MAEVRNIYLRCGDCYQPMVILKKEEVSGEIWETHRCHNCGVSVYFISEKEVRCYPHSIRVKMNKQKVEVEWSFLERIAEYYEFPSAVFLGDIKMFKDKTRTQSLTKKAELFDKIKDLIEEEV